MGLINGIKNQLKEKCNLTNMSIVGVFIFAFTFFRLILLKNIRTDIQLHNAYIQDFVNGSASPPANFLYFLAVYLFSFAQANSSSLIAFGSSLALSFSVAAKYAITRCIFARYLKSEIFAFKDKKCISSDFLATLFALALFFAFSIPMRLFDSKGYMYLGQIPPNVWHNSTTIFLMPFAFMLFWNSHLQIQNPISKKGLFIVFILIILNILIKPSFLFPFLVVYPLLMFIQTKKNMNLRLFVVNMMPVLLASLLILIMYVLIYHCSFSTTAAAIKKGPSGISFAPFLVWGHYSPNIAFSFLLSFLFPLVFVFLCPQELRNSLMQYAFFLFGVALLIYIFVIEVGPRQNSGNFGWQAVICSYMLFFAACLQLARRILEKGLADFNNIILSICLTVHVVSGVVYLIFIFFRGTYR